MCKRTPAVTSLPSGLVIDRSELVKLNSEEINNIFVNSCVASRIYVIDEADSFFTSDNMLRLIEQKDDRYKLIAEKAGIIVGDSSVAVLQRADELKAEIVKKLTPPIPLYPFEKLPDWWDISHLNINKTRVVRNNLKYRYGLPGAGYDYSISLKQAERLWLAVSPRWAKVGNGWLHYINLSVPGGNKNVDLFSGPERAVEGHQYVQVGCQRVYRFELEQLALKMGWAFPEKTATEKAG